MTCTRPTLRVWLATGIAVALAGCQATVPTSGVPAGLGQPMPVATIQQASGFADLAHTESQPATAAPTIPNQPLSLNDLEQLAQSHNPILQRDQARIESARGQALQAGLYPNPHFDTNNPEVINGKNSLFSVGVMQEIVVKGKLQLDTAAAEEAVRQTELTFDQNRLELLANVRRQYYTVLVARRRLDVLTELSEIVRSAAETGKKLENAQQASKIDTLLLVVDAQTVEASHKKAETTLAAERKQLAAIVGVDGIAMADIAGDLAARRPEFDEALLRRFAASGSTLVRVAEAEIARRRLLLQRAEVEPYPNVTLGPALQFGAQPGNDQFWLTVTFPIPVWDRNQGNILSAVANVRDAELSLRVLQNDQLAKVADTLGKYLSARNLVDKYEADILPNVRQAQKLSAEGYAKGVFDFARYLQAQRTVVETNLTYLEALEALWAAAADLAGLLQLERMP
ncbi:MAG TPA: TolC family protein [Gemmataceae bacterium]|jgi:cobalt-zinc-cadmium efflux system outer membrane protein|nr:TolC family protein [Gemmataceae bacterium]